VSILKELLEFVGSIRSGWADRVEAVRSRASGQKASTTGLNASVLKFSSAELASSSSLLLQHLLLMGVGVTNLNDVFLAAGLGNWSIVELADDLFTNIARLETKKTSSAQ
jgi:hypothetical protein